jgi:LysR family transcriptional activator of dmlA
MEAVRVRGSLSTNMGEMAHEWALDGHGIVLRSSWDVAENLRAGRLERVLPAHSQEADVWAVYPTGLSRLPKVEAFLGLLVAHLTAQNKDIDRTTCETRSSP